MRRCVVRHTCAGAALLLSIPSPRPSPSSADLSSNMSPRRATVPQAAARLIMYRRLVACPLSLVDGLSVLPVASQALKCIPPAVAPAFGRNCGERAGRTRDRTQPDGWVRDGAYLFDGSDVGGSFRLPAWPDDNVDASRSLRRMDRCDAWIVIADPRVVGAPVNREGAKVPSRISGRAAGAPSC